MIMRERSEITENQQEQKPTSANRWHEIWNDRGEIRGDLDMSDTAALFLEMKRINGWDFRTGDEERVSWQEFQREYAYTKERLGLARGDSVFECCCGCGANLYLFAADGIRVGGLDYAPRMIAMMREIFARTGNILSESVVGEAAALPTAPQYDAVMMAGATQYFKDEAYTERVLDRMAAKAKKSVGVLRILDEGEKEAFLSYRRAKDENYDERYRDLPKLFLPRSFFAAFAEKRGLSVWFDSPHLANFWNDPFVFDCFLIRR